MMNLKTTFPFWICLLWQSLGRASECPETVQCGTRSLTCVMGSEHDCARGTCCRAAPPAGHYGNSVQSCCYVVVPTEGGNGTTTSPPSSGPETEATTTETGSPETTTAGILTVNSTEFSTEATNVTDTSEQANVTETPEVTSNATEGALNDTFSSSPEDQVTTVNGTQEPTVTTTQLPVGTQPQDNTTLNATRGRRGLELASSEELF